MKQGTNLGSQIGRWIVLAALVAVLGALLLTMRPVGAQEAPPLIPNAETVFYYAEKGTGPVTTYRARDPEGNKIFWTLSGTDAGAFTIDGGALRFKSPPDYENPTDGENTGSIPPAIPDNNIYRVTVRFGGGGEDGMPGNDDYDGDDLGELDLTITVTNVDEDGMVYLSSLQPQVGTTLTATVTDLDGVAVTGSWQWANSDSKNGPWDDIAERSGDSTYRPVDADLGKYLRVTARYRDNVSGADTREKSRVSAYPVRKDSVTSNDPPKFPDQKTLTGGNAIARTATERFIHENSPAGTRVGAPVTAFDDDTDIEVLTYSLSGASADVDNFNIDPVTGQITVAAGAKLNADVAAGTRGNADTPYEVSVIATDGDGDIQTIEVDIRVVRVDEPPSIGPDSTASPAVVAAREMSHWEVDRTVRTATRIDTDLDSGVLDYSADPPTLTATDYQDATYAATDPEDTDTDLRWSLSGDDATRINADGDEVPIFVLTLDATATPVETSTSVTGDTATLAFAKESIPDFENPWDTNKDNVYEVTLVVTDSFGQKGEYPVTVKVINSTDDNLPGKVTILNRVPEIAIPLTAEHKDLDGGVKELKWQWYRSVATNEEYPDDTCTVGAGDGNRYFIDTPAATIATAWQAISGATSARYTPGYDEDSGGTMAVTTDDADSRVVEWTGGDIDVTITTTKATDDQPESTAYEWENPRCLRAAVTYRDAIDRTHAEQDDPDTAVDETLEGAFTGSEYPVKRIDEENDAPVFTEGGVDAGPPVSIYESERREDAAGATRDITEAFAATDVMDDEDDADDNPANDPTSDDPDERNSPGPGPGADILTYSLSGTDAKYFVIVGSVDHPTSYDPDGDGDATAITDAGSLIFKHDHVLDFETKTRYTVTITATDPSDDGDSVNVIVNLTNYNEPPTWVTKAPNSPAMVVYTENGKADVGIYMAKDPEGAGISYALVMAAAGDVAATDIEDRALFSIDPLDGNLRFKKSPNYEKPGDQGPNNRYQVTVQAKVVDSDPDLTPTSTPQPGNHVITREVTIVVDDENEAPVFSETTDTLEIKENPDDPEKEPPRVAGYEYLLNRGVGKPAANLPAAPNLDVGIPVAAVDDDSTGNFPVGGYADTDRDRIDGLTYTLSGTDAAHFHVVPATGQILTLEKLDYEAKKEYKVTVTATDPMGESDSINMTIEVTDVDEVPVPKALVISGDASHTYEENGTDALGEYTVVAGGGAMVGAWSLDGTDASSFMLDGTGDSTMLKFKSAPDYDNPMGGANDDSNNYEVTLKVTDSRESDTFGTFAVSVTVTDVDELGALSGDASLTQAEGGTDAMGTYTLTGGDGTSTVTWSLDGADMSQFTLDSSQALMFNSAPDYEMPADADGDNVYMVTVMAEAGGEMDEVPVTITVDNVEEAGTVILDTESPVVDGEVTATLSDLDGSISNVDWTWQTSSDDATWIAATGEATDAVTTSTYMPVEADAGRYLRATASYTDGYGVGNSEMSESAMVVAADVNVAPAFPSETATRSIAENTAANTNIGAPVAAIDPNGDTLAYTLEGTDAASFGIDGSTGQLSTSAALDYETKMAYTVVVKADDGELSDTIEVTINVTDVDDGQTAPMDPVDTYDTDGTPGISIDELFDAIDDYFDVDIELSIDDLFEVIDAYFAING